MGFNFAGFMQGLSQASNRAPEAMQYRNSLRLQREAVAREEANGKRNRLLEIFKLAVSSGDAGAMLQAGKSMKDSGLFPEMEGLMDSAPSTASGQNPNLSVSPSPPAPTLSPNPAPGLNSPVPTKAEVPAPAAPAAPEAPGAVGVGVSPSMEQPEITQSEMGARGSVPYYGPLDPSPLIDRPAPLQYPDEPKTESMGFLDALGARAQYQRQVKALDDKRQLRSQNLAEHRFQADMQEKVWDRRRQYVGPGIIYHFDPQGQIVVDRYFTTPGGDANQDYRKSQAFLTVMKELPKRTPSYAYTMLAGTGLFSAEELASARTTFENTASDISEYVQGANQTKLSNLNVVQYLAKENMQLLSSLRPEQITQGLGPFQSKYNGLLEKYRDIHKNDVSREPKAQRDALNELASTINDISMRRLIIGLAQEYEVFARMQTGAAISASEEVSFNNLIGSMSFELPALEARLYGMIDFVNKSRRGVHEQALSEKFSGDPEGRKSAMGRISENDMHPSEYMPYVSDQTLSQMVTVPGMYPGANAEWRRRGNGE